MANKGCSKFHAQRERRIAFHTPLAKDCVKNFPYEVQLLGMTGMTVFYGAVLQNMWGLGQEVGRRRLGASAAEQVRQLLQRVRHTAHGITPRMPRAQAFVYVAGVQLLLAMPRQALLGAAVGAAVGVAQRCNLLGLRELRVRRAPGRAAASAGRAAGDSRVAPDPASRAASAQTLLPCLPMSRRQAAVPLQQRAL